QSATADRRFGGCAHPTTSQGDLLGTGSSTNSPHSIIGFKRFRSTPSLPKVNNKFLHAICSGALLNGSTRRRFITDHTNLHTTNLSGLCCILVTHSLAAGVRHHVLPAIRGVEGLRGTVLVDAIHLSGGDGAAILTPA